jgi:hypothetical protein
MQMHTYSPTQTPRWRPLAAGIYATSCLTQASLLSRELLVTAGTDGHVVFWPNPEPQVQPQVQEQESAQLRWGTRLQIHQNNVQTMATHSTSRGVLLVSGGDDGGLGFVLVRPNASSAPGTAVEQTVSETDITGIGKSVNNASSAGYAHPPILLPRAHASAVTACAIFTRSETTRDEIFVLTAGNDEWVRLWLVTMNMNTPSPSLSSSSSSSSSSSLDGDENNAVSVQRLCRCKTSVADVSSMAVLSSDDIGARVLVCGVGMEVLRVEYAGETDEIRA